MSFSSSEIKNSFRESCLVSPVFSLVDAHVGNIDAYIQAVNRIPMLTLAQEQTYARKLIECNDLESARHLILSHLRLVVSVARHYLGYGIPHADLIQEGNIGLMKAVRRFDPSQNVRLVSYAIHWIKAEIHEYILRNWRSVKIATTKAQRKLFFNLRSHKRNHQAMSPSEIDGLAFELSVKREEVAEMERRLSGSDIALDSPSEDGEESFSPLSYLSDTNSEPTVVLENRYLERLQSSGLRDAIATLDPRSRRIIEARWLSEDNSVVTLHQLADEFGVSAERIRQIEVNAMKRMRLSLSGYT